jgi:hypothetical protein
VKVITNRSVFILATVLVLAGITACQSATKPGNANASANSPANTNASQTATNTSQPEPTKTAESSASTGSLATPTDTYKAGYAARKNKDIAGLKRVLSKEALDFLTEMGKEEKKTLDEQLQALADKPQAPTAESRNEKIEGDRATLEYLNERGTWSTMDFVKEGGDWKIGLPKAQ